MRTFLLITLFLALVTSASWSGVIVLGGLSRENTANPGDAYEGTIQLKNTGDAPCDVRIYQTDYSFLASGETFYDNPGTSTRSNAEWISINPRWLSIPGLGTASVHYSVRVPEDPPAGGTHWSVIMVEPTTVVTQVVGSEDGDGQVGLQTLVRYGIQIVTDIGGTGTKEIRVQDTRLVKTEDGTVLEIDLENIGEKWLSPLFYVELYDIESLHTYRFDGQPQRVYPGCSVRHSVDLTGVPDGQYKVLAIVDDKDEYVFGAQYDLKVE